MKTRQVNPALTTPPLANSTHRKNLSIWNLLLIIALHSVPIIQIQSSFKFRSNSKKYLSPIAINMAWGHFKAFLGQSTVTALYVEQPWLPQVCQIFV